MRGFLFFLLFPCWGISLTISEIFYGGDLFIPDSERYLEILNDGSEPVDMSKLTVLVPRSDTSTVAITLKQGNFILFEGEAHTTNWILLPGRRAVILSEDYNTGGRLLSWDTNTLLFKPSSKTSWTYSWANRLHLFRLVYNGEEISPPPNIPLSISEKGKALVWRNGSWQEDFPRPGQAKSVRILAPRVVCLGTSVPIVIESGESVSALCVKRYPSGQQDIYPLSGTSPYVVTLPGAFSHGETWILSCGGVFHKIRFLDTNLSSPYSAHLMISEILTSPKKDYSGGGWTGSDGGGTVNENDEWIEIFNRSSESIRISNWYLEHITSQGRGYRRLRLRYDGSTGVVSSSDGFLSPESLGILSVENGLANKATIILYDDHPLWGRKVAMFSYEFKNVSSSLATYEEYSLQRVPHNAPDHIARWEIFPSTYGAINGSGPYLVMQWNESDPKRLDIFMSDPQIQRGKVFLQARSELGKAFVEFGGEDGFFSGFLRVGRSGEVCDLFVKNGGKNTLIYTNEYGIFSWDFFYREDGWNFPEQGQTVKDFVIYPNPAFRSSEIYLSKVISGAKIIIFDEKGRVLTTMQSHGEEYLVWKTPEKPGLYCFLVSYGGVSVSRWLLVR
ncbi:hypothetical protein [Thermospira aquatica]|uniref:LTD domain-containing protein n=1 Tax=Thermospira aquatica TaxID=2828656 RepID=A0AAX3BG67_9SPIR|nr:hypothetical protein [Thermospira aquatica]URA11299.1 hypothetical protein KDW03_05755 [Thermospira aquatica]